MIHLSQNDPTVIRGANRFAPYMEEKQAKKLAYLICDTLTDFNGYLHPSKEEFAIDRCAFVAYLLKAGVNLDLSGNTIESIFGMSDWASDDSVTSNDESDSEENFQSSEDTVKFLNMEDWPLLFWTHRKNASPDDTFATIIDVPHFNNQEHNFIVIGGVDSMSIGNHGDTFIREIISDVLGFSAFGYCYNLIGSLTVEDGFIHGMLTKEGARLNAQYH